MILNKIFGAVNKFNISYVLGEIVLIFIGISLSFYFDEWRTERQNKRKEQEILSEILTAVKIDTNRLQVLSNINAFASRKMTYLLDSTRLQQTPSRKTIESFGYLNFYHPFDADLSAYNNLKTQGLDMITNQKLRISMIRYYDQMAEQHEWTTNIGTVHFQQNLLPYVIDEFSDYLRGESAIPEDFDKLKKNKRFWKIVKRTKMFYDLTSGQLTARKQLAINFIKELEKEIEQN